MIWWWKSEISSCWNSIWEKQNSHERINSNIQSRECFFDEQWINTKMSQQLSWWTSWSQENWESCMTKMQY